jgi:hypothetical protein
MKVKRFLFVLGLMIPIGCTTIGQTYNQNSLTNTSSGVKSPAQFAPTAIKPMPKLITTQNKKLEPSFRCDGGDKINIDTDEVFVDKGGGNKINIDTGGIVVDVD